jgi:hypothetical protein
MKNKIFLFSVSLLAILASCIKTPVPAKPIPSKPISSTPDPGQIARDEEPVGDAEDIGSVQTGSCSRAKEGLKKHGGQILFDNSNAKCHMVSGLQVFLHSKPIFDALCKLDASRLKEGSATYLVYKLFMDTYDPDRDPSKNFPIGEFAGAMTKDLLGKDFTCSDFLDSAEFLSYLLEALYRENPNSDLASTVSFETKDDLFFQLPGMVKGGDSIKEMLTKWAKAYSFRSSPSVIFAKISKRQELDDKKNFMLTKGLSDVINLPGLGNYEITGMTLEKGQHYTSRIKDLKTGDWDKINSLPPSISHISFADLINELNWVDKDTKRGLFVSVVALRKVN